jgi:peptide/nickel transport system substrate-binding protein
MGSGLRRRDFVKSLVLAGGGLLAAACSPGAPPASAPTPAGGAQAPATVAPAAAPTAADGGAAPTTAGAASQGAAGTAAPPPKAQKLVFGSVRQLYEGNNNVRSGDPMLLPMYEGLLGIDVTTGKFIPQLAERWQPEPNGKDWRFYLRKGVQFHNNMGEMTADDVVFTFDQVMAPGETNNQIAQEVRDIIDHWQIVNPYELVLVAKVPDATLPFFASQAVNSGIMSKRDFEARGSPNIALNELNSPPLAGTGPWQYKSRALSQNVVFEQVPYKHWRVNPDFQTLEIRIQAEVSSRLESLLSGETALAMLTRDTRTTAMQRGMKVLQGPLLNTGVFVEFMGSYLNNPDDPSSGYKWPDSPVMDVRVRKALSKAVDRDALNKLFQGDGSPMYLRFHEAGFDGPGFNPDWESRFPDEYGYDPAAARQLLADAGFGPSNPLQITVELTNGQPQLPEQDDVLEAIAQMWKEVGVQADLETLDRAAYVAKQRQFGFNRHVYLFGIGQPQNWVLDRLLTAHRQTRGQGFENYEFEAAFLNMLKELDDAKRTELWKQVGDLDYQLHTAIPLFWLKQELVADPKVVAGFDFPGNLANPYSMLWNVKAA